MKRKLAKISITIALSALATSCISDQSASNKRTYISIVGSSTISPFITSISEEFSRSQHLKNNPAVTPVSQSTGTRHGLELFCEGAGLQYPDFTNASRQIEQGEIDRCSRNGVNNIVEIRIGYDGIVFGKFAKHHQMQLTKNQIFLALAEKIYDKKSEKFINNPHKKWSDIDQSLPQSEILIYGPPLTSGTRDVFHEMVMEDACFTKREFLDAYPIYEERKEQCHSIRKDGVFVESGENDDTIIHHLKSDPDAIGIIGFNFLVANSNSIQALKINDVAPNPSTISSKRYPLSRPLFVYFKKEHVDLVPGIRDFVKEIISEETIGQHGYLVHGGLIPLRRKDLAQVRNKVLQETK